MSNNAEVVHNSDANRFELTIDGQVAELDYRRDGDRLILTHTGVPGLLEGQGIGGKLVSAAVDQAETDQLTIVARCSFARDWLERHPEAAGRVTIEAA